MKLLLLSNSTNAGEPYLGWAREKVAQFVSGCKNIAFIPFAGVTVSYSDYELKVQDALAELSIKPVSIHHSENFLKTIAQADAIFAGGGNTFKLVEMLHKHNLMETIAQRVKSGIPFVGWSAGSNITCPRLCTTNDMPIVQPASFNTLNLIPFQINPHYIHGNPPGHAGETRQQRIEEFLEINREITVVGLRESSYIERFDNQLTLGGTRDLRLFRFNTEPVEYGPGSDISFLLQP